MDSCLSEALKGISLAELTSMKIKIQVQDLKNMIPQSATTQVSSEFSRLKEENAKLRQEIQYYVDCIAGLRQANSSVAETGIGFTDAKPPAEDLKKPAAVQKNSETGDSLEKTKQKKGKSNKSAGGDNLVLKNPDGKSATEASPANFGMLDLRVGRIVEISKHADADSLYVEKIDLGEEKPRTVVSGLVKHIPATELKNQLVIVLTNLKPAKMRGILSEGMVMCASTPEAVEILIPPSNSLPGDVVVVDGYTYAPEPQLNPKKKVFETLAPDLRVNSIKQATYLGVPWHVKDKGIVMSRSLCDVSIK